jgi:hypothetical protein
VNLCCHSVSQSMNGATHSSIEHPTAALLNRSDPPSVQSPARCSGPQTRPVPHRRSNPTARVRPERRPEVIPDGT